MTSIFHIIPNDIFRDKILPYTYLVQPYTLLEDIRSYHTTNLRIRDLYAKRFPADRTSIPNYESDHAWLSNDINRFLNQDIPLMYGFVQFYKDVFRRLYMNRFSSPPNLPDIFSDEYFTDIKVSLALLVPSERKQLETFLGAIE